MLLLRTEQALIGKKHFVLVHGSFHGAWCWYKVATLLKSTGHHVTAVDLAASGTNQTPVENIHSFADYVEPLIGFLGSPSSQKERVILVAHSMSGAAISIAMERFPEKIAAAVFVTARMPGPALSYLSIFEKAVGTKLSSDPHHFSDDMGINSLRIYDPLVRPNNFLSTLYHLPPPEDLTLALSAVRPSPIFREEIEELTEVKYGVVPRIFIVCDQDLALEEDLQMWMIMENPPNEVKVINGSDHMVMFSKPLDLFSHLLRIAEKYSELITYVRN